MAYGSGIDYEPNASKVAYTWGRTGNRIVTNGKPDSASKIPEGNRGNKKAGSYLTNNPALVVEILGLNGDRAAHEAPLGMVHFTSYNYRSMHEPAAALTYFSNAGFKGKPAGLTINPGGEASWLDAWMFIAFGGGMVKLVMERWIAERDDLPESDKPAPAAQLGAVAERLDSIESKLDELLLRTAES